MRPGNLAILLCVVGVFALFMMLRSPTPPSTKLADIDSPSKSFADRWQRKTQSTVEISPEFKAELRQMLREELKAAQLSNPQTPPASPPAADAPADDHGHQHVQKTQEHAHTHSEKKEEHHLTQEEHDNEEFPQTDRCMELKKEYNIHPGKDWGDAGDDPRNEWRNLWCDDLFSHHDPGAKRPINAKLRKAIASKFGGRATSWEVFNRDVDIKKKPKDTTWITMLTPMTVSNSKNPITSPDKLIFWQLLWPSFLKTSKSLLASKDDKYWYSIYVGYDDGDPLFSLPETHVALWEGMQKGLRDANFPLHKVGLRIFAMNDTHHAPSWAVSHLAQAAFDAGADYFYQVNDDVEMHNTGWEDGLIKVLKSSHNVGVTGPRDRKNLLVLTQSFVHRTHIDIFGLYFPEPFKNWWSDNWLTAVYGPYVHREHEVVVTHEHEAEGQRYPVHEAREQLEAQIQSGKQLIRDYIAKHKFSDLSL